MASRSLWACTSLCCSHRVDDWQVVQGLSFIILLTERIDAGILKAAKKVAMTRKELLHLISFLKMGPEP